MLQMFRIFIIIFLTYCNADRKLHYLDVLFLPMKHNVQQNIGTYLHVIHIHIRQAVRECSLQSAPSKTLLNSKSYTGPCGKITFSNIGAGDNKTYSNDVTLSVLELFKLNITFVKFTKEDYHPADLHCSCCCW